MLTHLIEYTPAQLTAAAYAFNDRVGALLGAIREAIDADYLTADQVRDKVWTDLRLLRPALANLMQVSTMMVDERLAELDALMAEYREVMAKREQDEAGVADWNTRAEAEKMAAPVSRTGTALA